VAFNKGTLSYAVIGSNFNSPATLLPYPHHGLRSVALRPVLSDSLPFSGLYNFKEFLALFRDILTPQNVISEKIKKSLEKFNIF
jgi:hypothetical protein